MDKRGRARKTDLISEDLLRRIVTGELAVGSLLPKETELVEEYEVNRSVVREAIKLLEVHRLVRPVRRLGTVVLDPLSSHSPEVLQAMLLPRPGALDRAMLAELLEIRAELDVQMTTLAAARRTEGDLAALDACLVKLQAAVGDVPSYAEAMEELALIIAKATQNRIFVMLVHWHQRIQRDVGEVFMTVRLASEAHVRGYAFLLELIRQQETEHVRTLVTAYHQWATPRLLAAAALAAGEPLDAAFEEILNND